jgi:hypothetical protein
VDALRVILKMHLMLEPHLTNLALEPISFSNASQMLRLEVLRQVSWTSKLVGALLER